MKVKPTESEFQTITGRSSHARKGSFLGVQDEFADLKVDLLLEDAAEARIDLSKMVSGHYHNIDDDFDPYDEDLQ